jgi:shikimate kinase
MDERLPFYQETAHLTIDTANLHIHEITFGILESARVFRSR